MLPAFNAPGRSKEKRLRGLFQDLNEHDQETLLRFAEFLSHSSEDKLVITEFPEPVMIQRPDEESVVKAIKRLTATYPMINKDKLLHQTSDLMAGHVLNGRSAKDVIDDLQAMFAEHYHQLKNDFEQNC